MGGKLRAVRGRQVRAREQSTENKGAVNGEQGSSQRASTLLLSPVTRSHLPLFQIRGAVAPPFVLSGIAPFISPALFSFLGSIVNNLSDPEGLTAS